MTPDRWIPDTILFGSVVQPNKITAGLRWQNLVKAHKKTQLSLGRCAMGATTIFLIN